MKKIILKFEHPIQGYWDGGLKTQGIFEYEKISTTSGRWGCWELNFWFKGSKDIKKALKKLDSLVGVPHKIEILMEA